MVITGIKRIVDEEAEETAIKLIREFEELALRRCPDKGYIVGYSGGKDSDDLVRKLEEEHEELRAAQDEAKRATEHNKTLTFTVECFQKTLAEHEAYITGLQNYRLKRFATELSKKLCEFLDENEDNAGKIDKAIFLIDVIGVTAKDGTVISKGIIDNVMEEFTNCTGVWKKWFENEVEE